MEEKLREYARLLVEIGVNIQKGQNLVLSAPVECASFARMCAAAAYAAGCREVIMSWGDDFLAREKYLHAADEVFDTVPRWRQSFFNDYAEEGAAYLAISASDPENLKGVDGDRIIRAQKASGEALKPFYRLQMANGFPWCIASIPIPSWAEKVFPGCPNAVDRLWEAIFAAVRITGDGKAVDRWHDHLAMLERRKNALNRLRLTSLHYHNSLGTDLTIRLPERHLWASGGGVARSGQPFIANIPTEEIFTAPLKTGVDGVVYASLPLCHDGNVIDGFHFVVREGRIVEARAKIGEETLLAAISVDEGASYFGEVALVPYDSPISNQGILFYNTLFDENASCHLAFGEAYNECLEGGEAMDKEDLKALGLNDSLTHVDFMVGTADLSITGRTAGGREIPVFRDGNFAPELEELA